MIDDISEMASSFYSSFLMRDFTYIFSGCLVITIAISPLVEFNTLANVPWFVLIAYLACSYVLGLLLQEAAVALRIARAIPRFKQKSDYLVTYNYAVMMDRIHKKCHPQTLFKIERYIYLKTFGTTIGMGILVGGVIAIVYSIIGLYRLDWWQILLIGLVSLSLFLLCMRLNRIMTVLQFESIRQLRELTDCQEGEDAIDGSAQSINSVDGQGTE